ncbi:hypothetical protein ACOBQX_15065 [Actinokineospora sp. G85]|uniref:hypothetical protein n=1 Tax=Actinokineospora sp. G85 TaxID=3406626 RepID=UPI003C720777
MTKTVQDTICPDAETRARLGVPGSGTDRTSWSPRNTAASYAPGKLIRKHTVVPPAVYTRKHFNDPATR